MHNISIFYKETKNEKDGSSIAQYYNTNFLISNLNIHIYRVVSSYCDKKSRYRKRQRLLQVIINLSNTSLTLNLSRLDEVKNNMKEAISNLTINFKGHRTACNFSCYAVSLSGQKEVLMSRGTSWQRSSYVCGAIRWRRAKEEEAPRTFPITSRAAKLEQPHFCVRGCLLPRAADQLLLAEC